MPTISSSRVNPVETPCTALAASARVNPCSAAWSSEARNNSSLPSFCSILMPSGMGTVSDPLGPVTCSFSPICTLTPLGSGIGFLPILDIVQTLKKSFDAETRRRGEHHELVLSASLRLCVENQASTYHHHTLHRISLQRR